jgi:hypothetical protein
MLNGKGSSRRSCPGSKEVRVEKGETGGVRVLQEISQIPTYPPQGYIKVFKGRSDRCPNQNMTKDLIRARRNSSIIFKRST